jgi:hypothetical protein
VVFCFLIILVTFITSIPFGECSVNSIEANTSILDANNSLRIAFEQVSEAAKLRANVSELFVQLSVAEDVLNNATANLSVGNYRDAVNLSSECKNLSITVTIEAQTLAKNSSYYSHWLISVLLSIVSGLIFITSLFFIWRRFKPFYKKRFLESKPRIA